MLRAPACLLLALALALAPRAAQAESPACECATTSATATVVDALPCFTLAEESLDVCYGNDAVIQVTNDCAFDVVVKAVPDFGTGEVVDKTIAAGTTDNWQQDFTPTLNYEESTTVSMSWALEADGASHTLELTFVGHCMAIDDGGGDCQGGSAPMTGWLTALALGAFMALRRRATQRS